VDSHEFARKQQKEAEYLLSKPAFKVPSHMEREEYFWYMWDREGFVEAVKALGAGIKSIGPEYVEFRPKDAPVYISIERDKVCKMVRPAEYDCEPWLTEEDHQKIDVVAQNSLDTESTKV
jgi:hypothetical protein